MKVLLLRLWRLLVHRRSMPAEEPERSGRREKPGRKSRGKKKRGGWIPLFLLLVGGAALLFTRTAANLEEVAGKYAISRVNYLAGKAINQAVAETIAEEAEGELVEIDTDTDGNVTALRINMIRTNQLKTAVTARVIEAIHSLPPSELAIPVGSLFSSQLFSGRGPSIPVRLLPLGDVETRLESQLAGAGINQTRHRILLTVTANVGALLPGFSTWTEVTTSVSIAETVLVGRVPNAYTYLEDTGRTGMEIYGDFDLTGEGTQP